MPTLAELHERYSSSATPSVYSHLAGEVLIYDQRSRITPVQAVEKKLGTLLRKADRLRESLSLGRRKPR